MMQGRTMVLILGAVMFSVLGQLFRYRVESGQRIGERCRSDHHHHDSEQTRPHQRTSVPGTTSPLPTVLVP